MSGEKERRKLEEKREAYPTDMQKTLGFALDVGKSMIKCGAEMNRVEETIIRICHAYGMIHTEVFSIVSMISVTTEDEDGNIYTQSRRVHSYGVNMGMLEKLNSLSREICACPLKIEEAKEKLGKITYDPKKFHWTSMLGAMVAAGGFALFFGGTVLDAVAAMPIAILIYVMNTFIKMRGINKLFYTFLCSLLSGALAIIFVKIGFGTNESSIMIGDIMLIIPGIMLINSVRELLCGDLMSGLLRMIESVILAFAIACGFAVPILFFGKLGW